MIRGAGRISSPCSRSTSRTTICSPSARTASPATTTSRTGIDASASITRHPSPRGFTLLELTFVTAILAVLVAVSMPRLVQTASRLQTEGAAVELTQRLRAARQLAVATGQVVVWRWDATQRRAHLDAESGGDPSGEPLDHAPRSRPLPGAFTVEVRAAGSPVDCACARFFPDGTSEAVTVTLTTSIDAYTIALDAATSQPTLTAGRPAR